MRAVVAKVERFTEGAAQLILEGLRWPDGIQCLSCGSKRISRIRTRNVLRCLARHCRRQFTVTTGTVFENHKMPLSFIVTAMIMYQDTDGKVPAMKIKRALGVSYKSAFVLKRKINEAHISDRGLLAEPAYISRWYWQGFNTFFYDDELETILRMNKRGELRDALE